MDSKDFHVLIEGMSLDEMRAFLDEMLKQPYLKGNPKELFARLENGRYALRTDGAVRFYRVSGTAIRRLYELTGAPGSFREQQIYRPVKILSRILEDKIASAALFGMEVGICGRCGSPLTREHTRKRGIGDDCYAKMTGG
jgi:hypothetical protein